MICTVVILIVHLFVITKIQNNFTSMLVLKLKPFGLAVAFVVLRRYAALVGS